MATGDNPIRRSIYAEGHHYSTWSRPVDQCGCPHRAMETCCSKLSISEEHTSSCLINERYLKTPLQANLEKCPPAQQSLLNDDIQDFDPWTSWSKDRRKSSRVTIDSRCLHTPQVRQDGHSDLWYGSVKRLKTRQIICWFLGLLRRAIVEILFLSVYIPAIEQGKDNGEELNSRLSLI